jgi:hypothetical protein
MEITIDKMLTGLLGAAAVLGSLHGAQAAPSSTAPDMTTVLRAESFADLLTPIPNAVAILQAADKLAMNTPSATQLSHRGSDLLKAQFGREHHHHHHGYAPRILRRLIPHHHHSHYRRDRYHHHHHSMYRY